MLRVGLFTLLAMLPLCLTASALREPVVLGNEVLRDEDFKSLQGYRLAVLTNPTGVFADTMTLVVDALNEHPLVNIVAVLSPEHGFRGDHQAETGDPLFYIDKPTGLPVFSAYNMSTEQLGLLLAGLDVEAVLVDMQDVGVRLYTFIWTMFDVMEAAALQTQQTSRAKFIIADRPNPLGGLLVDGPLVDMSCASCVSGYGKYPIPFLHGMTIGELALLFADFLHVEVEVAKVRNWNRQQWTERENYLYPPWVPPSPNLPTLASAHAYGATVFLEATTAAEGRGTTTPFTLFGAPFLDAEDLAAALDGAFGCTGSKGSGGTGGAGMGSGGTGGGSTRGSAGTSGSVRSGFRAAYFQPTWSKYNGTTVPGVQWLPERTLACPTITPINTNISSNSASTPTTNSPFADGVRILCVIRDLSSPSDAFQWDGSWFGHPGTELIDFYAGTPSLREMIDRGLGAEEIVAVYQSDVETFRVTRAPFLLYEV
ncbi:hypothetical protein B484DRAFT_394092 [Ochromonadaceae sp. CCMP2298]|nr:hypothetical protein B484DRAFT_394092 [Ochromonadaceae sp. CCMP2298]